MRQIINDIITDIKNCKAALVMIIAYCIITNALFGAVCPFFLLTGLPCPACGLTRAGIALLTGHFKAAWMWNPSIYVWIPFLIVSLIQRYLWKQPSKKVPYFEVEAAVVGVVTVVVYAYRVVSAC